MNKIIYLSIIMGLLLFSPLVSAEPNSPSIDMNAVRTGADFGDKMITSGQGSLTIEYTIVDSLSERTRLLREMKAAQNKTKESQAFYTNHLFTDASVAFEDIKLRVAYTGMYPKSGKNNYEHYWENAFDGEKGTVLRLDAFGRNDMIIPMADIYENDQFFKRYNPCYYSYRIYGMPVARFLGNTNLEIELEPETIKTFEKLRFIGNKEKDGVLCHVFQRSMKDGDKTLTVWLAPEYLYRPVYYEIVSKNGDINTVHSIYKDYGNGVWFPEEIILEYNYFDYDTKKLVLEKYFVHTIHDFELNIDLPNDLFHLTIPKGVSVSDHRTNEYYVEGMNKRKEDSQPVKK